MLSKLNEALKENHLKLNASKTKVVIFERESESTNFEFRLNGMNVEIVKDFVYLGCKFEKDGRMTGEFERRILKGRCVLGATSCIAKNQNLSKNVRLAVHGGVLIPTLMYGSEAWTVNESELSKVHTVEMDYLRSMIGKKRSDRVRNDFVREECGANESVKVKIKRSMLRWFGHIERMNDERLTKKVYVARIDGCRGRGRPRKVWMDQISEIANEWDIQSHDKRRACMKKIMTLNEMKEVCKDRKKWRLICKSSKCFS